MIRLLSSFYDEANAGRHAEITKCLRRNTYDKSIDEVYLFLENVDSLPFDHDAVLTKKISQRPTYSDFFHWVDDISPVAAVDLTIIANSDIYFDQSIRSLCHALKPHQCAAITRWDITASGAPALFDRNDSQDVWVFRGPLKEVRGDFGVGVPRCDNRFLYELKQAGYEVINPAFSVRTYHLHAGLRPEYSVENLQHSVDPPYAYLWPHNLWSLPRTVLYNLRHPDARLSWRFDRRKFARWLPVRAVNKIWRASKGWFGESLSKHP